MERRVLSCPAQSFYQLSPRAVTLRLAAGEVKAVGQREIYADHVSFPLCPLSRVIRKLQLMALDACGSDIELRD